MVSHAISVCPFTEVPVTRQLSVDAICTLIEALMPKGYPPIEAVASLLCVSTRSLQRQLNAAGVSYSGLVDRCRCRAACVALELTGESMEEIATTLGYRSPSSFARAFRRWTGTAPRAYRRLALDRHETLLLNRQNEPVSDANA